MKKVDLFLDSGAYSAFTKNVEIDIDEYIAFIKKNKKYITTYANLDSIGNPEKTLENQIYMESKGLKPLPTFHYGTPISFLELYLQKYKYIALGGMVPVSTNDLSIWLDNIFGKYICDAKGKPRVKVHGFGLTVMKLLLRYPWFSVDSTSWVLTGRMGSVYIPKTKGGVYNYEDHWKITVSNQSPTLKEAGRHLNTLSKAQRDYVMSYVHLNGFVLGKSKFREESATYELEEDEKWCGKENEDGSRVVEKRIELGVSNDYRQRDHLNILYFKELEKQLPKWPSKFKHASKSIGMGL